MVNIHIQETNKVTFHTNTSPYKQTHTHDWYCRWTNIQVLNDSFPRAMCGVKLKDQWESVYPFEQHTCTIVITTTPTRTQGCDTFFMCNYHKLREKMSSVRRNGRVRTHTEARGLRLSEMRNAESVRLWPLNGWPHIANKGCIVRLYVCVSSCVTKSVCVCVCVWITLVLLRVCLCIRAPVK